MLVLAQGLNPEYSLCPPSVSSPGSDKQELLVNMSMNQLTPNSGR